MGKELIGPDSFHGFTEILLSGLKDQLIHDVWLDLFGMDGKEILGKLHIKFQWIHSKITFHADHLEKIRKKIEQENSEKQRLESNLEKITFF